MDSFLYQALQNDTKDGYLHYHAPRYDRLLTLLHRYHTDNGSILDIGRSPFSAIAHASLNARIDTLGFEQDGETETGLNYHFDLNDSQASERWRSDIPHYDIIVFSEVLEHLYTSPGLVLKFLRSILSENGVIIIQTPNAVVLHKRFQMLIGRNPYSLIAEDVSNPAHFREYTAQEISGFCEQAGFRIEQRTFENYFDYRYTDHANGSCTRNGRNRLVNILYSVLPSSFRPGLCFVIRPGV